MVPPFLLENSRLQSTSLESSRVYYTNLISLTEKVTCPHLLHH
jgi:hypothetical protein